MIDYLRRFRGPSARFLRIAVGVAIVTGINIVIADRLGASTPGYARGLNDNAFRSVDPAPFEAASDVNVSSLGTSQTPLSDALAGTAPAPVRSKKTPTPTVTPRPVISWWPAQGHDANRTSRTVASGPSTSHLKWTYPIPAQYLSDNDSPVVGPDGTVYVQSHFPAGLFAISSAGSLKWSFNNAIPVSNAPALSSDGKTLYTYADVFPDTTSSLVALNTSNGALIWRYPVGNVSYSSIAIGADGTLYIGTWEPALYAIKANGMLKWKYSASGPCAIESAPAVTPDGTVYVVQNCVGLLAIDSNGTFKWSNATVTGAYEFPTPTIGPDGTIYLRGPYYGGSPMYALRPDGSIKWTRSDVGVYGIFGGVALSADGATVYTAGSGTIYALATSNGTTRWSKSVTDAQETFGGSPALAANGILYLMGDLASGNDYIYAVSTGARKLLWSYQLNSPDIYWGPQSPALGPDGTLYVVSSGSNTGTPGPLLYAFGP